MFFRREIKLKINKRNPQIFGHKTIKTITRTGQIGNHSEN